MDLSVWSFGKEGVVVHGLSSLDVIKR